MALQTSGYPDGTIERDDSNNEMEVISPRCIRKNKVSVFNSKSSNHEDDESLNLHLSETQQTVSNSINTTQYSNSNNFFSKTIVEETPDGSPVIQTKIPYTTNTNRYLHKETAEQYCQSIDNTYSNTWDR